MTTVLRLAIAVLPLCSLACGAESPAETAPLQAPKAAASSGPDLAASCQTSMVRARECTDEYLPALVDLRVRLDQPAGIAQAAQSDGRDALLAQAREEWASDSTDQAIAATCERLAASVPPEDRAQLASRVEACAAEASCADFVACLMPVHEEQMRARAGR